jgi:chemotaxis protein methyltransferase CheR
MSSETRLEALEAKLLLEALAEAYGADFRAYAPQSMKRRLRAARDRLGCKTFSALQDRILHDRAAFEEVLPQLTIQVSEMFRDPAFFRALRNEVLPYLSTWPSLKVWVAGCADGEELYSLVILFREAGLEERTLFYATDISAVALARAKAGIYPVDKLPAFSTNYQQAGGTGSLSDHYTAAYGWAKFDTSLRQKVVFADHNLVTDSVFTEAHLVTCRNVMIYFKPELQKRAIGLFTDSLVHGGFLGLGAHETLRFSPYANAFKAIDQGERIYCRTAGPEAGVKRLNAGGR